jgi:hypothetical protein
MKNPRIGSKSFKLFWNFFTLKMQWIFVIFIVRFTSVTEQCFLTEISYDRVDRSHRVRTQNEKFMMKLFAIISIEGSNIS